MGGGDGDDVFKLSTLDMNGSRNQLKIFSHLAYVSKDVNESNPRFILTWGSNGNEQKMFPNFTSPTTMKLNFPFRLVVIIISLSGNLKSTSSSVHTQNESHKNH